MFNLIENKLDAITTDFWNMVEMNVEAYKFGASQFRIHMTLRSFDGYPVYTSNGAIATNGCAPKVPQAAVMVMEDKPVIVVNDGFNNLDVKIQEAILAHEIGHILNGDSEKLNSFSKKLKHKIARRYGLQSALDMEVAADKYAQDQGHDMIGALTSLKSFHGRITRKEIDKRISILKGRL